MIKNFVLWGSSGHAKVLADIIKLTGHKVIAIFDNSQVESSIPDVPIFIGETAFHQWADINNKAISPIFGLAAIGGARGRDRIVIHDLFRAYGFNIPVISHPSAVISQSASIGIGSHVLSHANISADAHLGEGCIVNSNASVDHECQIGNGVHIAPGATLCGCVTVGNNVFIGAGAVILPRIKIGDGSIIGAGSIVTKNIPAGFTVAGNPAKSITEY